MIDILSYELKYCDGFSCLSNNYMTHEDCRDRKYKENQINE